MEEIHQVVRNLASWTAPDGQCLMGVFDVTDYTGIETPYPQLGGADRWIDTPAITGVFWSFYDAGGLHQNMIAPALGYWIDLYSRHFRRVEIVRWPHDPPFLNVPRRNLLPSQKRDVGDDSRSRGDRPPGARPHGRPDGSGTSPTTPLTHYSRLQTSEARARGGPGRPEGVDDGHARAARKANPVSIAFDRRRDGGRTLPDRGDSSIDPDRRPERSADPRSIALRPAPLLPRRQGEAMEAGALAVARHPCPTPSASGAARRRVDADWRWRPPAMTLRRCLNHPSVVATGVSLPRRTPTNWPRRRSSYASRGRPPPRWTISSTTRS